MVRADQGIRGRATPRSSKPRSSISSAPTQPPTPQITKAAKRALKRAELLAQAKSASPSSQLPALAGGEAKPLSKSSLKRLKKKQRNNLAGNRQGLKELEDVVDNMQQQLQPQQQNEDAMEDEVNGNGDADDAEEDEHVGAHRARPATTGVGAHRTKDAVVTEKARKKALAHEMLRQPHILSDPSYAANPFAALRLHAQNTLAFDRSAQLKAKALKNPLATAQDVDML
ncbi:hypothetical protein ACQY0O_004203 [Thecaphora frezii]